MPISDAAPTPDPAEVDPAEVARGLRVLLEGIDEGELVCSADTRRRLEGAALAFEVIDRGEARALLDGGGLASPLGGRPVDG